MHKGTIEPLAGAGSSVAGLDDIARARVADRILGLITATRDLGDACADLADALRPLPGSSMNDPLTMDFARLRAERTATLLDEAALAARGTLGLLDRSYRALGDCPQPAERPLAGEPPAGLDPSAPTWQSPTGQHLPADPSAWPDSPPPAPEFATDQTAWPESPPPPPEFPSDPSAWPDSPPEPMPVTSARDSGAAERGWAAPEAGWRPTPGEATGVNRWPGDEAAPAEPAGWADHAERAAGWARSAAAAAAAGANWTDSTADDDSGRTPATVDAGPGGPLVGAGAGSVPPAGTARSGFGTEATATAGWRDVAVRPSRHRADDRIGSAAPFAGESEPTRPEFRPFGAPGDAAAGPAGERETADGPAAGRIGRREDRGRLASFFAAAASSVQIGANRPAREAGFPVQAESRAPTAGSAAAPADSRVQFADPGPATVPSPDQTGWPRHASPADPGPPVLSVVPSPPELPLAESRSLTIVPPLTRQADPVGERSAEPAREAPTLLDEPTREQPVAGLVPAPRPASGPRPVSEQGGQSDPASGAAAAVIARQVEAARRHLQAAVLVAHDQVDNPRLAGVLDAVENVLAAIGELARHCRAALGPAPTDRTFPGEARFLCAPPWERYSLVSAGPGDTDPASPGGLARLLRALGYEAYSVTGSTGVAGVQVRSDRYAAHVALVEPAGGGRQRWSGALEWMDPGGTTRTWAETLGPVELDEEELARRVDELLRRCVGPTP